MAAKTSGVTLADEFNAALNIRLYGHSLDEHLSLDEIVDPSRARGPSRLAMIHAFAFGSYCKKLPLAVPLLVWGEPQKPGSGDACARPADPNELVWSLPHSAETVSLNIQRGALSDLLAEAETRGIDGGLQIENPRFEGGKLCATVHVWAKISVFGHSAGFDERINVCIPLEGCYTIWSIAIAHVDACFRAPSELCIKLCVGKWGLEKCWDACAHINIPAPVSGGQRPEASRETACTCSH